MDNIETLEQIEQIEALEPVYDMLELLISRYGHTGIAAAMFAESAGVPFASTIVLFTAGTMILRGSVTFWSLMLYSTIGITLGSIFSYVVGLLGSMAGAAFRSSLLHHHPWKNQAKSDPKQSKYMQLWSKYGNFSVFMGQLWGFTRTFGSFPAGAMHMNFFLFVIYTFLGGALFSFIYIAASMALTGTMGATISFLKAALDTSLWLFVLAILIIIAAGYAIMYKIIKGFFPDLSKIWMQVKGAFECRKKKKI